MHLKLFQTSDSIGNKIADRITKIAENPQRDNLETATNEHGLEISKETNMFPEGRQKIIDDMRVI